MSTYKNGDLEVRVDAVCVLVERLEIAGRVDDVADVLYWKVMGYGVTLEPEHLDVLARNVMAVVE